MRGFIKAMCPSSVSAELPHMNSELTKENTSRLPPSLLILATGEGTSIAMRHVQDEEKHLLGGRREDKHHQDDPRRRDRSLPRAHGGVVVVVSNNISFTLSAPGLSTWTVKTCCILHYLCQLPSKVVGDGEPEVSAIFARLLNSRASSGLPNSVYMPLRKCFQDGGEPPTRSQRSWSARKG